MTTDVKMVGKLVENTEEIRAYIKVRTKLGHSVVQIFTKLGKFMGLKRYIMRQLIGGERNS